MDKLEYEMLMMQVAAGSLAHLVDHGGTDAQIRDAGLTYHEAAQYVTDALGFDPRALRNQVIAEFLSAN